MRINKPIVGLITIDDHINYGNRLQNYALTALLNAEGIDVINGIQVYTKEAYVKYTSSLFKRVIKQLLPFSVVRAIITPKQRTYAGLLGEKEKRFRSFSNEFSSQLGIITEVSYSRVMQKMLQAGIEYFIVGSDQVWNPYFEAKDYEFLTFAPKEMRFSFAASMGVDEIPKAQVKYFKERLNEMKYLSVREQRAVDIIKELTGRDADLTLDPTLLLETEKWRETVRKPKIDLPENYICTYFLGNTPEAVKRFAREKRLPICALNSDEMPELFVLNPSEFLYMIQNATYILTDSFHAVAFSIKFHKEFYVFDREQTGVASMFSRIETITKKYGLENRIQNRKEIIEQKTVTQWEIIDKDLIDEKKRSMGRLLEAMEIG